MIETITISAPAKINLTLRVVGRRADGYHLLETVMLKLDLADELTLNRAGPGIVLEVFGADLPTDDGNLVVRAARSFFRATGIKDAAVLRLRKRIPVAAGLGGGSSDAAATLAGLNRLWDCPLTAERLRELGLALGADVPFFLGSDEIAWAEGIGERLGPGPVLPGAEFLLVNPGWPLATCWVYQQVKMELTSGGSGNICGRLQARAFSFDRDLHNDLEAVVTPRYPEIDRIKACLMEAGALGALMSGSGPTVFGAFAPERIAEAAILLARTGPSQWNTWMARTRGGSSEVEHRPVPGSKEWRGRES